jgi:FtsP/CotA-like multicopper oxidase with cupredoxin domain
LAAVRSNPEVKRRRWRVRATLEVKYGENQRIAGCPVHLRSYNGQLVGPTLRAKPGDKIIIHLKNMLPPNPPRDPQNMNMPHDFNTTNLHTHGLHVSPSGISDNVLRQMPPPADGSKEADYEVEIDIPANHPAGTFWYHPHVRFPSGVQRDGGALSSKADSTMFRRLPPPKKKYLSFSRSRMIPRARSKTLMTRSVSKTAHHNG